MTRCECELMGTLTKVVILAKTAPITAKQQQVKNIPCPFAQSAGLAVSSSGLISGVDEDVECFTLKLQESEGSFNVRKFTQLLCLMLFTTNLTEVSFEP